MPWIFNPFTSSFDYTNAGETASSLLTKLLTVDGAGSGLDADLLDGQSSAYYATAAADALKVLKAGDTMTGALNIDVAASTNLLNLRDTSSNPKLQIQHGTNTVTFDAVSSATEEFSNIGFETDLTGWAVADVASQLFYDAFTGVDGTQITSHTPDVDVVGGGWVAGLGASYFKIISNKAVINASAVDQEVYANVGTSTATISTTFYTIDKGGSSIPRGLVVFRNPSNAAQRYIIGFNIASNLFGIFEGNNTDGYTTRASTSLTVTNNQVYLLQAITTSLGAISATVDGANTLNYTGTAFSTRFGLQSRLGYSVGAQGDIYDDFTVTP